MNTNSHHYGKVILAGAGPGDPELISVKACNALGRADVIICDRLVSDTILRNYANPIAEIIYAGKQAGKGYSTRQTTINALLVEHAMAGKQVVRLKGGDIAFFSNVLDELQALKKFDIPVEIIPGITAASGASASAAIPLTARNHATAVRFLTFYTEELIPENGWRDLATTDDTLVFYMSANKAFELAQQLIRFHPAAEKKIAVIEQATTPMQYVEVIEFTAIHTLKNRRFKSPSLIIIGKVVQLHEQFKWNRNYSGNEEYFRPLSRAVSTGKADKSLFDNLHFTPQL